MLSRQSLPVIISILLCAALYSIGLDGPFLFDSKVALHFNPDIQIGGALLEEWRIALLSSQSGPLGRPISMFSFAANYVIAGSFDAFAFKLVNLLLHLGSGLLIWLVLRKLLSISDATNTSSSNVSLLAGVIASLWLLHPLHVSVVLYTVQRMAQLSMLFNLLGLLMFLNYRSRWLVLKPNSVEIFAAVVNLGMITLLAGLCKENGLLLPWLLVLVEVCFFNFRVAGKKSTSLRLVCLLLFLIPLLIVALTLIVPNNYFDWWYQDKNFSLIERLYTQSRVLWQYVYWILLPDFRTMGLHHDDVVISTGLFTPLTTFWSLLAWVVVTAVAWIYRKAVPILAFSVSWFLVAHSMESSFVPLEMAYEHRNYLPSVGMLLGVAWVSYLVFSKHLRIAIVIFTCMAMLYSVQLYTRTSYWSDELLMAKSHLQHHPKSPRSVYHYANTLLREAEASDDGEIKQLYLMASRHAYKHILELDDSRVVALVTLIYLDKRYFSGLELERWKQQLELAAESKKFTPEDFNSLKLLLSCYVTSICAPDSGYFERIIDHLIARYSDRPDLHEYKARYFGLVLKSSHRAIVESRRAIELSPDYFLAYYTLLSWYVEIGDHGNTLVTVSDLVAVDKRRQQSIDIRGLFRAKTQ